MRRNPDAKPEKTNDQWTEYDPPSVVETDEAFVYHVSSNSDPSLHYVVDLTQRDGHGSCGCVFFVKVADPAFRRHGKWIPYAPKRQGVSECQHLRAAWDCFHLNTAVPMMARFKDGIPSP